jgi:hypothetical protein
MESNKRKNLDLVSVKKDVMPALIPNSFWDVIGDDIRVTKVVKAEALDLTYPSGAKVYFIYILTV